MFTLRTLTAISCSGLALLAAGCSNEAPSNASHAPTTSTTSSTPQDPVTVFDYVEEPETTTPTPTPIAPDRELMNTMTCEPLPQEFLETYKSEFGIPLESVHIKVGEGLTPGQDWWVVVYDSPADAWTGRPAEIRRYLTTSPGVPNYKGDWIKIGKIDPWKSVHWDDDKLVVAQSALDKALGCLED